MGACTKCPSPAKAGEAAGVLLGVLAAIAAAAVVFQKRDGASRFKKALVSEKAKSGSKSLLKIAIGFYTIVGTMDFTFGVPWPEEFAGFLRAMQLLTLDLSSLSGFFCTVSGFSFYDGLLTATLVTLSIVSCICVRVLLLTRKMRHAEPDKQENIEDKISSLKKALFYVGRDLVAPQALFYIVSRQAFFCTQFSICAFFKLSFALRSPVGPTFVPTTPWSVTPQGIMDMQRIVLCGSFRIQSDFPLVFGCTSSETKH
jgi:hypothetical protein